MVEKNGVRRCALALLLAGALVQLSAARADVWTFNLFGAPTAVLAEDSEGAPGETITLTGAGTFDADQGTISAGGAAVLIGGTDHPFPPLGSTLRGTWHATEIMSFTPDEGAHSGNVGGMLVMKIQFDLALGNVRPTATVTVMEDGISIAGFGPDKEEYVTVEDSG